MITNGDIDNHGWTYSTTIQSTTHDTWIYREDLGVYSVSNRAKFLYGRTRMVLYNAI